ncbi:hypothetical protein [Halogeometricum pallidum]|uniref:hypothetical protein n=1 Tax=Halogeometricum pallidum TaxID=411361 RepID=UPI00067825F6|nr:hypothetical protein [Halogeometricum pallidum]
MGNQFLDWQTQHNGNIVPILSKISDGDRRVCIVKTSEKEGEIIVESESSYSSSYGRVEFDQKSDLTGKLSFVAEEEDISGDEEINHAYFAE